MDDKAQKSKREHDFLFLFLKWALILCIALTALVLITKPLRKSWSNNYLETGDSYLLAKKYLQADLEYKKALTLYRGNTTTKDRVLLANNAALDVEKLEPLYKEKNIGLELDYITKAHEIPASESDAVRNSRYLIEHEEYQLAIIAATIATEINKDYRDGWLYLGIANLKTAANVQLRENDRRHYLDASKEALAKAKDLDSTYQPTLDYLKEAEKQI